MPELKNTLAESERSALKSLIARNHGPDHVMLRDEMIDFFFKASDAPGSLRVSLTIRMAGLGGCLVTPHSRLSLGARKRLSAACGLLTGQSTKLSG